MSLARFLIVGMLACSSAVVTARPLYAAPAEGAVEHAEQELAEAAEHDPSHGGASTDPMSVSVDLAIFTFILFLLLLAVLRKFAWGPIMQALERREHNIAEHISQAERNHEQARLLLADYEQRLANAAGEVRELLEEARRDAESTKQSILAEARQGAEAEKARALRDIEAAGDAAMEQLAQHSARLAVDLASKIMKSQLTQADHARLIEEAMAKFPASSPSSN